MTAAAGYSFLPHGARGGDRAPRERCAAGSGGGARTDAGRNRVLRIAFARMNGVKAAASN